MKLAPVAEQKAARIFGIQTWRPVRMMSAFGGRTDVMRSSQVGQYGMFAHPGDREVALAASRSYDHVRSRPDFPVVLDARGIQSEAGRLCADALPRFHLALVTFFQNLGVQV
jgi:hypothetical protein